jgi:quercetin dioxygenase-like cupin family protein
MILIVLLGYEDHNFFKTNRRCAVKKKKAIPFLILMALLFVSAAEAQMKSGEGTPLPPTVVYQAKFPITVQGNQYDLLTMILDFSSGAGVPKHFHGGHALVTVLSGEMTLIEKNVETVIKAGESWTENPGAEHAVVNKGATARVAVSMLLPKGAEAQTLVQ